MRAPSIDEANDKATGHASDKAAAARPLQSIALYLSLGGLMIGGMVACAGIGRLFVQEEGNRLAWVLALCGGCAVLLSGVSALLVLRRLGPAKDDCARYGRHIVGLTFSLLVAGMWNSTMTSTLALEGDLGLTAETFVEATNSEQMKKARAARAEALTLERQTERGVRDAQTALNRAVVTERGACAKPAADGSGALAASCIDARIALEQREDALQARRDALLDAQELRAARDKECDESRRILFFLLSMSTLMALFGAAFYVVNRVRTKRPHFIPEGGSSEGDAQPGDLVADAATATVTATVSNGNPPPATSAAAHAAHAAAAAYPLRAPAATGPTTLRATLRTPLRKSTEEPFDAHSFWSGAFFRIGEAVLFTFAFFWLIWTSAGSEFLVWLPVLALFVGMFVKTGETIVFRLGLRILSAAEALLPAGPGAVRFESAAVRHDDPDDTHRSSDGVRPKSRGDETRPN